MSRVDWLAEHHPQFERCDEARRLYSASGVVCQYNEDSSATAGSVYDIAGDVLSIRCDHKHSNDQNLQRFYPGPIRGILGRMIFTTLEKLAITWLSLSGLDACSLSAFKAKFNM